MIASDDVGSIGPFQEFFQAEALGGALLVACASAALVVANFGLAAAYHHVLETSLSVAAGSHALTLTVHQWINDGLMAAF